MAGLPNLTRRLVLETPERAADGAGGHTETWVPLGTLWAGMTALAGREQAAGQGPVSRVAWRIVLRAAPPGSPARPRPGQRLTEGARHFAITAVAEGDVTGRYLTVFADEEVTA
jgi:head-tail adaptor